MHSTARNELLSRLRIFNNTLLEENLIDKPLIEIDHNSRARLLRNGLSIIAFNVLEDFIKNRINELLIFIANTGISFIDLPEKMQEATLLNSVGGTHYVAKRMKSNQEDWKLFIQTESNKLASSVNINFELSSKGFGHDKSNLDAEDIKKFLNIFQVDGAFQSIESITNNIGCTLLGSNTFFQNAAKRRHTAAHDPNAESLYTDLETYGIAVKSFALAFDFLIARAACFIRERNRQYINAGRKVQPTDIAIRFIRKQGVLFKEMSATNSRPILNLNTEVEAVNSLINRANYRHEMIVVVDYPNKVHSWYTSL